MVYQAIACSFSTLFLPVFPLSSPCLSGLSALFQGKGHTFIEHLWYTKQLLVLSPLSSRPLFSTDLWALLSCASFHSLPGEEIGIYGALTVCLAVSLHSPCPLTLPVPSSLTSPFFLLCLPFLGDEKAIMKHILYTRASLVAQLVKNLPAMQTWVRFLGWEDPLEKGKVGNFPGCL